MEIEKKKAILIDIIDKRLKKADAMKRLQETEELVLTFGGAVIVKTHQRRTKPHLKTYIGPGKVEEIAEEAKNLGANLLIVNGILKPRQIFELSELLRPAKVEVWDRIDLILKIFAKHATTTEAKLEIELASIRHMGPRIFGMGMELSRQGGGIGTVGIGEQNTEIMKRHLRKQEDKIKKKLQKYHKVRDQHKKRRRRIHLKTASLIGYTNAGKTTLFNALTKKSEYAANKLFATLDTRVGKIYADGKEFLLTDTIGFIKNLPPDLINAFRATLSEVLDADILMHVVDASREDLQEQIDAVNQVLQDLGADDRKIIFVLNKKDLCARNQLKQIKNVFEDEKYLFVSALTREGLEDLKELVGNELAN